MRIAIERFTAMANRLMLLMESRIHGNMYVRFGGRSAETCCRKAVRRRKPSLLFITTFTCVDKDTRERIKYDDYRQLSEEMRKQYNVYPKLQAYRVFNVQQTNLQEARPEMWAKLETEYVKPTQEQGERFSFAPIDAMIKDNRWICPIKPQYGNNAYFSISKNMIVVPEKQQFVDGESFYGTLFHEMAHSTGHETVLDRFKPTTFGSSEYAREELVAELGSALVAQRYGMAKHIKEDSAAYLKSWLESLKESPQFIKTTLLDVKKATSIINQHIDKMSLELEEAQTEDVVQKVVDNKTVTPYYASVAYLQSTDDTSVLDSLKDIGDYDRLLQEAKEYDQGDAIDLEHTYKSVVQNHGDDVLVDDSHYAVVYNGSVGGTYEVMRKVTEEDVRDSITRYGLPSEASKDVEEVAKSMIAEDFSDLSKRKAPVFEMPNGDVLHLQYDRERDSFEVGTVTNAGLAVQHILSYDHSLSLADNIEDVYNTLCELPDYQLQEENAEEENVAKATFRR